MNYATILFALLLAGCGLTPQGIIEAEKHVEQAEMEIIEAEGAAIGHPAKMD